MNKMKRQKNPKQNKTNELKHKQSTCMARRQGKYY